MLGCAEREHSGEEWMSPASVGVFENGASAVPSVEGDPVECAKVDRVRLRFRLLRVLRRPVGSTRCGA